MRRALFLAIAIGVMGQTVFASTMIYYNQAQWLAAMVAQTESPLIDVSFATSDWTSSFSVSHNFDALTSQSSLAASNGMAISAVAGYSPLGVANNALLGQASNGVWSDTLSKYGSTTFNFGSPIYGFGGDFDISGSNGLEIFPGSGGAYATPNGIYDGFIGFVFNQPLSSIMITSGQNGNCDQCFGNSYTLDEFQVATAPVPVPEPNLRYLVGALLVFGVSFAALRRS